MIPLKKTWFHAHMFFTKQILPLKKQLQNEQQQEQALADAFGKNEVIVCEQRFSGIPDEFCNESVLTPDPFILRKTSLYQRLIDKRLLKPPIF